jgi:hypothetical protein
MSLGHGRACTGLLVAVSTGGEVVVGGLVASPMDGSAARRVAAQLAAVEIVTALIVDPAAVTTLSGSGEPLPDRTRACR